MHLRENAADGVGKRRDFYPLLLNRVLSNEKRRRKKLKDKGRRLVLVHWGCSKHGRGAGAARGGGTFKPREREKKN